MITFDDIENYFHAVREASNREEGGVKGQKRAILVPHIAATVDDFRARGE
jgi:hypothetical protein